MKIVIPGGAGQIGALLTRAFRAEGHEVVVLSRDPGSKSAGRVVQWDARTLGDWSRELDGADLVINLAGRNVNCRYNARNRREILDSRVDSTRIIGQAIARATNPPKSSGSSPEPRRSTPIGSTRPTTSSPESSAATSPTFPRPGASASRLPRPGNRRSRKPSLPPPAR